VQSDQLLGRTARAGFEPLGELPDRSACFGRLFPTERADRAADLVLPARLRHRFAIGRGLGELTREHLHRAVEALQVLLLPGLIETAETRPLWQEAAAASRP
jgi:hypothetical protein